MTETFAHLTLKEIKQKNDTRIIRVYADGVYDLFHYGHIEQLKQAKLAFPNIYLIVGVVTDEDCTRYKGGSTVMTHEERVRSVSGCFYVDEVISNPPFFPTIDFINGHRIDLVAHDSIPYKIDEKLDEIDDCYAPFKTADRFLETARTPCISTTDLIQRIIDRVEDYTERNTHRVATIGNV